MPKVSFILVHVDDVGRSEAFYPRNGSWPM